jgi:hypothetical protein
MNDDEKKQPEAEPEINEPKTGMLTVQIPLTSIAMLQGDEEQSFRRALSTILYLAGLGESRYPRE